MMWKNGYRASRRPVGAWWNDMWRYNRHIDHLFGGTQGPISSEYPPLEVWSSNEGLSVIASLAGIDLEALEIEIDGQTLKISGNRPSIEVPENARSYRRELVCGQFNRKVELPYEIDVESVMATYSDGLLEIELPRIPEEKPRKISVKHT
jgi:HSP20 family protein